MSESTVYLDRELRKLKPAELYKLAQILRVQDSWKKLMAIVPRDDDSNLPRFNIEHISMIEQAAQQQQGNAVEIFLSEWGTMGKTRPTLRFLLSLLTKAQLFRAADYVAAELLNEELPKRPEFGPAAPVDISDEMDRVSKDNEKLANLDYNESLILGPASPVVDNETINPDATNDDDDDDDDDSFERNMQSTKLISSRGERNKEQLQNDEQTLNARQTYDDDVSDLMKFSNSKEKNNVQQRGKQIFDQREIPSDELPVFLNEFERSVEQTIFNREVSSEELPLFLNDSATSSNETSNYETNDLSNCKTNDLSNCKTNDLSNRKPNDLSNRNNINRNEMTSTELSRCIVEFRVNNVFDSSDSCTPSEDYANLAQNVARSTELPITVLEYNE